MSKPHDVTPSFFKRETVKKIFFYSLTIILIILPLAIALIVVSAPNTANTSESTITVTLKNTQGDVLASESVSTRDLDGDSLASIINNLNEGKTKISSSPELDESTVPLIATIKSEEETTELICYFSLDGADSYCNDIFGNSYIINKIDAMDFLTSKYAESLYPSAALPILKTIDGEEILPNSLTWNYKNVSNGFSKASPSSLGSPSDKYAITGQIDVAFSIEPDACSASVYDVRGNKIFGGNIEGLKDLIVNVKDSVRVTINAEWKKRDSSVYYGSARYDFNVVIAKRSDFSVSSTALSKDGFVILEATNIEDLSKIKFKSSQSDLAPEFIFVGTNLAEAILTYPTDIGSDADTFSFSISYRASMESFTLDLNSSTSVPSYEAGMPYPAFASTYGTGLPKEIQQHLHTLNEAPDTDHYNSFNPRFLDLSTHDLIKSIDYGSKIIYSSLFSSPITSKGCEFISESYGVSVPSLNAGLVVIVGKDNHLGNFVVIDHGMGLNVWYCNLSDVDVSENTFVTKGQSVGKTGTSKLSGNEGFWIYLTFKDKILDPNAIIK